MALASVPLTAYTVVHQALFARETNPGPGSDSQLVVIAQLLGNLLRGMQEDPPFPTIVALGEEFASPIREAFSAPPPRHGLPHP